MLTLPRLLPRRCRPPRGLRPRCSFCGKAREQRRIVAGPAVAICHDCVRLCAEIIAEENARGGR